MWGDCYVPTLATEGEEETSSKGCLTGATLYVTEEAPAKTNHSHTYTMLLHVCADTSPGSRRLVASGPTWACPGACSTCPTMHAFMLCLRLILVDLCMQICCSRSMCAAHAHAI